MAVTQTTRLGIYRWSSNDDEFTRAQMDTSHQQLEDLVALFTSGTFALRPAAAASNARGFYLATDTNVLYYSNGTAWFSVNSFASPVAIVPGDSITDGGSTFAARADHKHSLPAFGLVGDIEATNATASAGTDVLFARADHRHTIGAGSVVAGSLAVNSINAANLFTAQVVERDAIKDLAVSKAKLAVDQQNPAGAIIAYGGTTAPTGWKFCDGTSYLVSELNDLYNAIGYRYGGSGLNFNVPDLRDRVTRGAATTGAAVTTTSTDSVTIAASNLPQHTHDASGITVDNHANHVHDLNGVSAQATNSNVLHTHFIPAQNTNGQVNNPLVVSTSGAGAFGGLFYVPSTVPHPNNDSGGTLKPNYFSGGGYEQPVANSFGTLVSNAVTTLNPARNTDGASNNGTHNHSLSGSSGNPTSTLTHVVGGSTGNNATTATALTVVPRHQTVNYIIKT